MKNIERYHLITEIFSSKNTDSLRLINLSPLIVHRAVRDLLQIWRVFLAIFVRVSTCRLTISRRQMRT